MVSKKIPILIFSFLFVATKAQVPKFQENFKNDSILLKFSDFIMKKILANYNPDTKLSVPELILKNGYSVEIHTVQTEDNYLLTVHRIPFGKQNKSKENRKPIFLMHGILASSADWILMGPERSLGYLLADMGYDVWIGNARGNKHSRNHVFLDPNRDADTFWNFSWHEIGMYDLPAIIDYILELTNYKQLRYIGHSQGCTAFFVMTSMRPEYNEKIIVMFALAPAVFMGNARSPFLIIAATFLIASKVILSVFGRNEFLPSNSFMKELSAVFCDQTSAVQDICENTLFMLAGFDEAQMDRERLPVMLSNTPAGCSTKQIVHFLQNTKNYKNSFNQFDYGLTTNMDLYSSTYPPEYPLDKVTARVALFSGYNDLFVDVKDVDILSSKLQNVFLNYRVPFQKFTHLDFLWAKNVVPLLYHVIFEQLEKFN